MNRTQWQKLAERWLEDAKALLDAERWPAAYYLAGYAIECGLKACVLVRVATEPQTDNAHGVMQWIRTRW